MHTVLAWLDSLIYFSTFFASLTEQENYSTNIHVFEIPLLIPLMFPQCPVGGGEPEFPSKLIKTVTLTVKDATVVRRGHARTPPLRAVLMMPHRLK